MENEVGISEKPGKTALEKLENEFKTKGTDSTFKKFVDELGYSPEDARDIINAWRKRHFNLPEMHWPRVKDEDEVLREVHSRYLHKEIPLEWAIAELARRTRISDKQATHDFQNFVAKYRQSRAG